MKPVHAGLGLVTEVTEMKQIIHGSSIGQLSFLTVSYKNKYKRCVHIILRNPYVCRVSTPVLFSYDLVTLFKL